MRPLVYENLGLHSNLRWHPWDMGKYVDSLVGYVHISIRGSEDADFLMTMAGWIQILFRWVGYHPYFGDIGLFDPKVSMIIPHWMIYCVRPDRIAPYN
jgi:hypothetical protein